jgi:hypothetical protein
MRLAHRKNSIDIVDELAARIDTIGHAIEPIGHAIEPAESASQVVEEEMTVDIYEKFFFLHKLGNVWVRPISVYAALLEEGKRYPDMRMNVLMALIEAENAGILESCNKEIGAKRQPGKFEIYDSTYYDEYTRFRPLEGSKLKSFKRTIDELSYIRTLEKSLINIVPRKPANVHLEVKP